MKIFGTMETECAEFVRESRGRHSSTTMMLFQGMVALQFAAALTCLALLPIKHQQLEVEQEKEYHAGWETVRRERLLRM